jgi:hypothetical protein
MGGRHFWRQHLRRLKFYNPALPITVDYAKALPTDLLTLTLRFEHKDPEVLRNMPGSTRQTAKNPTPKSLVRDEMSEDEKELLARQQDPNFRNAPVSWKTKEEEDAALHQAAIEAEVSPDAATEGRATDLEASVGQITEESAASSAVGASAEDTLEGEKTLMEASPLFNDEVIPTTTSTSLKGAPALYTRSVTLGLNKRSVDDIWKWFSERTRCTDVEISQADANERAELDRFFEQSTIDRELVREGREAVRKEKADLERARGDADRLKQEAM